MIIAFGVVLLGFLGVIGLGIALVPATAATYAVALGLTAHRPDGPIWARVFVQSGVFFAALGVFAALAVVGLFAGIRGDAGSGVQVYGMDFDALLVPSVVGGVGVSGFLVVAGEVAVALLRRRGQRALKAGGASAP